MFKMRNTLILGGLLAAVAVALAGSLSVGATKAADGPQVAHMVYFKLKDSSGANRAKLAASCKLFLTGHEGTVSFAVGTLAGDLNGPFNDHDFDIALHMAAAGLQPRVGDALQIAARSDELGAEINAGSSLDTSFISLNSITGELAGSLELFSDILLNPTFPEQ